MAVYKDIIAKVNACELAKELNLNYKNHNSNNALPFS
jgi:hypothetical protein